MGKTLKDYPEFLKQWDYEKNDSVDPLNIPFRSNKSFYWKCSKGHSYKMTVDHKTSRNTGCPICSNKIVLCGFNDFASKCPTALLDWDYGKNQLDPTKVVYRSIKKVHWKCHKCGFEWVGEIRDASSKTTNCPKCSKKQTSYQRHLYELKKNGCITDKNLILDWDYSKNKTTPQENTKMSNKAVFWKCHKCGYEWESKINNRSNGRGCPCCSNRVLVPGKNDLETLRPNLAKEWHPTKNGDLTPRDIMPGSGRKVWWLCPNGHEYQISPNHRTSGLGTNCPICNSGRQTSFREQALYYYIKQMYPDTISRYKPEEFGKFEIDIFIPKLNFGIEYDGVAWHKSNHYEREQRKYKMCQEQGIHLIRIKEKMPEELGLMLADEIYSSDDFESEEGFTDVIHRILDRLDFSDFYVLHPMDVNLSRDRFEIMKYATELKRSFKDEYPNLAKEWHPTKNNTLKPTMFKPKSTFKAWWLCPDCGNEYEATLNHRANGTGCPKCALKYQGDTHRMNMVKRNGSISNPLLLKEWNYEKNGDKKPEQYTRSSGLKVWWKCSKCGYEYEATIANREIGRSCPKCSGRKLFVGYNDFATLHPDLLIEWDYTKNKGFDPHKMHHGSEQKVWWKCSKCGYEYQAPLCRRDKGSGCRKCADKANPTLYRATMIKKHGSLGDICPNLIEEYSKDNKQSIFEIGPSTHQKIKWICKTCGHHWEAAAYSRRSGSGCPECYKKSRKKH